MKHLRYNMPWSGTPSSHPQDVMKRLGITYQHATPQSLGDQWWFWNCENIPEEMPDNIEELNLDPIKCIGFGLSKEEAEKIRDYKTHTESSGDASIGPDLT